MSNGNEGFKVFADDVEITAKLQRPDFTRLFPHLTEEQVRRLEAQWISWVNTADFVIMNWLVNDADSNYNALDILGLMNIPAPVIIDVLKARGYLVNEEIDGGKLVALVRVNGNYALLYFGVRRIPNNISNDVLPLYEYYGCVVGRQYITCQTLTEPYRIKALRNIAHVIDTEVNINFVRIDTDFGSYAFDPSFRAISDWMIAMGMTSHSEVIKKMLSMVMHRKISHYATGFIYDKAITWSPGIIGFTPRRLTKNEAKGEVEKLRNVINEVTDAFERPSIALAVLGIHVAYAFFRPYRKIMNNADTPVPLIFGYPNLNKTTLANLVNEMFNVPEDIELITEGTQVTETIPRLAGLMTESTLPVVLDDVIMNDVMAKIIQQIGASVGNAINLARARKRGPGLEDKIPIMRMMIPIMNAESENDVINSLVENVARQRMNRAQLMALLGRRVLPFNMNRAMPRGEELRKTLLNVDKPDVTALLNYVVENYHDDLIKLMRQEYEELSDKYLNFLWFAYGLWKYLIPAITDFKVQFIDVVDAIREIAEKREEKRKWELIVQKIETKRVTEREDEEKLRSAYQSWLEALNLKLNGISDELIALIRNRHKARVVLKKPKAKEEIVKIKRNLANLICAELKVDTESIDKDFVPDLNTCAPAPWVSTELFNEFTNLFRNNLLAVYVLWYAFKTKNNPNGIGAPNELLGRSHVDAGDGERGFRFTLDDFITILYPSLRKEFETEPENSNSAKVSEYTNSAHLESAQNSEASKEVESVQSPNLDRAEKSAHISAETTYSDTFALSQGNDKDVGEGMDVSGKSSIDCEIECRNKHPGTDSLSFLAYQQCLNECRLMGDGQ